METFRKSYSIDEVLRIAVHTIDTYGWISRDKAVADEVMSTSDMVIELLMADAQIDNTREQIKEVQEAIEWIHGVSVSWIKDSTYNRNLHSACSRHSIHISQVALVASVIPTYRRWNELLSIYNSAQEEGLYIGVPLLKGFWRDSFDVFDDIYGEDNDVQIEIQVQDIESYTGSHGKVQKIKFVDRQGRFGHFTNNVRPSFPTYEKDCWYVINGTVREHRVDSLHMRPETMLRKVHQIEKLL